MTLVDAGPLVALHDARDRNHSRCRDAIDGLGLPLVTTWPAFAEVMHLVGRAGGWTSQASLWKLVQRKDLLVAALSSTAVERAAALMEKYADQPMDLADASLVALAEERDLRRIFTLDADFRVYRLNGRRAFEIVPQ